MHPLARRFGDGTVPYYLAAPTAAGAAAVDPTTIPSNVTVSDTGLATTGTPAPGLNKTYLYAGLAVIAAYAIYVFTRKRKSANPKRTRHRIKHGLTPKQLQAGKMINKLKKTKPTYFVTEHDTGDVFSFHSKAAAEKYAKFLSRKGIKCILSNPRKKKAKSKRAC